MSLFITNTLNYLKQLSKLTCRHNASAAVPATAVSWCKMPGSINIKLMPSMLASVVWLCYRPIQELIMGDVCVWNRSCVLHPTHKKCTFLVFLFGNNRYLVAWNIVKKCRVYLDIIAKLESFQWWGFISKWSYRVHITCIVTKLNDVVAYKTKYILRNLHSHVPGVVYMYMYI